MKTTPTNANAADLAASTEKLARDIAAIAAEAGELFRDAGGRNVRAAQDALVQAGHAIRSGTSDFTDAAGGCVRAHPFKSIGGAAVAGLVLGLLLARS